MNPGIIGRLTECSELINASKAILDAARNMGVTEVLLLVAILSLIFLRRCWQAEVRGLMDQHHKELRELTALLAAVAKDHSTVPEEGLYGKRVKQLFTSHLVKAAVEQILDQIRHRIESRLKFRGVDIHGDIAVTLKVALHRSLIPRVLPHLKERLKSIPDSQSFVLVTFARDPSTMRKLPRREVREYLFTVNANAAFNGLIMANNPHDCFACDDLAGLQQYFNETENWNRFYNATLVVPIYGGVPTQRGPNIKGFLCIDSQNLTKAKIYDDTDIKELALLFAEIMRTYVLASTGGLIPPSEDKKPD